MVTHDAPHCRCAHNVLYLDEYAPQWWSESQIMFGISSSMPELQDKPLIVYPVSLFEGLTYDVAGTIIAKAIESYSSLAYLFGHNDNIQSQWGDTLARDLATLPRTKKEMSVYIDSIKHREGELFGDFVTELFGSFFMPNDFYNVQEVHFASTILGCAYELRVYDATTGELVDADSDPFIQAYSADGVLAFYSNDLPSGERSYYVCYVNPRGNEDEICALLDFVLTNFDE